MIEGIGRNVRFLYRSKKYPRAIIYTQIRYRIRDGSATTYRVNHYRIYIYKIEILILRNLFYQTVKFIDSKINIERWLKLVFV